MILCISAFEPYFISYVYVCRHFLLEISAVYDTWDCFKLHISLYMLIVSTVACGEGRIYLQVL
jgi:hypothetical protein